MNLPAHKKMLSAAAAASVMLLTAACGSGASVGTGSASSGSGATTQAPASNGEYKDGDYDAEGSYSNPGGNSTVKVALTITGNKVTAVSVTPEATNGTSRQYQTQFAGGVSSEVVGRSLDDVKASKVAGSSLTSQGFNKAIEQIKADAAA